MTLSDRLALASGGMALATAGLAVAGVPVPPGLGLALVLGGFAAAALLVLPRYAAQPSAVALDDTMRASATARGGVAWAMALVLTAYYAATYWFPGRLDGLVRLFDPLSHALRGRASDVWFVYGTFYTLAVAAMGVRALVKYRRHPYHRARTLAVMAVQTLLAWALPALLVRLQRPELYFSYTWPLDYDFLFPSSVQMLRDNGTLGLFALVWGVLLLAVVTPVLTYFYGKRWYCAWVCGCGGLAETAGDPYRHLADPSLRAWKIERWTIYSVLVLIVATTALVWLRATTGFGGAVSDALARFYGFGIGAVFSGVVGVGFYPLLGARVWCRFGCPMAAILGIQQRFFSRFRITVNGGACISCGNCTTYCEMGIDVRHYAQRGQNIVRASCVGCGACASVCPRGVLRLENGPGARMGERVGPGAFVPEDALDVLT